MSHPRVSVIMPVLNEAGQISAVMECIARQTRLPDEVVVADGGSTDGTREWLDLAARQRPWLKVVNNPRRVIPAGLNVAIAQSSGEIISRMDAHAAYAEDYLERLLEILDARPDVVGVGGAMSTAGAGAWGRAIAAVLGRSIGLGGARHRTEGRGGAIEHVFCGTYRRSSLELIGGFDEQQLANEDFEADARLRAAGGTIWLQPAARCTWFVREGPRALGRQMVRYGYYRARTMVRHPWATKSRQLVAPTLVMCVSAALLLRPRPGLAVTAAYLIFAGSAGGAAANAEGASFWRGALVPPIVHLSWGTGCLAGLVRHSWKYWREAAPALGRP